MQPNREFVGLPPDFWANIRVISQEVGYTNKPHRRRGTAGQTGSIKVPNPGEIKTALETMHLSSRHLLEPHGDATGLGKQVLGYFEYRARILNEQVEPLLMDAQRAEAAFTTLKTQLQSSINVPMNKQSAEKKRPAFFAGMVNMLIDANLEGLPCDYDPRKLTMVTRNDAPFRTLARRIDGAFPGPVDP